MVSSSASHCEDTGVPALPFTRVLEIKTLQVWRVSLADWRPRGKKPLPRCGWSAAVPRGVCFLLSTIIYGSTLSWTFQPFLSTAPGPVELCDRCIYLHILLSHCAKLLNLSLEGLRLLDPILDNLALNKGLLQLNLSGVLDSLNLSWRLCWAAVPDWMSWTSLGAATSPKSTYRWLLHTCRRPSPSRISVNMERICRDQMSLP